MEWWALEVALVVDSATVLAWDWGALDVAVGAVTDLLVHNFASFVGMEHLVSVCLVNSSDGNRDSSDLKNRTWSPWPRLAWQFRTVPS